MQLVYALLAEAAERSEGKISLLGGDFDMIRASAFPAKRPTMALVVKLGLSREEAGRDHRFEVCIRAPDGTDVLKSEQVLNVPEVPPDAKAAKVGMLVHFGDIIFPVPGEYAVKVRVGENEIVNLPLHLVQE
jgi:hypothetical protein